SVACAAGPVVAAELLAITRLGSPNGVVLGRVLDLVLGALHVDARLVEVDRVDHPGGQQHLPAEDTWTGVDDDVAAADVVARLMDLADLSIDGVHREAD